MKKLSVAIVGAGNRGRVYGDYSLAFPDELQVVAVVDTNKVHLEEAAAQYKLPADKCFSTLDDFLAAKLRCDFVVDATMDQQHYATAKPLLEHGYNLLLEKPITPNKEQLLELQSIAKKKSVTVIICHVLRYTPYFVHIKKLIDDGAIGQILTMELDEHVGVAHFVDSYVRGKWRSEAMCGSGFLLAKSCHDMDIMCWLNNATTPQKVSSLGSRSLFVKDNMPADATPYCYECPHVDDCMYSAKRIHLEFDSMPYQTWLDMDKPVESLTKEEKEQWLKHSYYGKCVFDCDGDINDRQVVTVQFANGSVGSFTMVGGSTIPDRYLHIVGTKGEIRGSLCSNKFTYIRFKNEQPYSYDMGERNVVDISKELVPGLYVGHGGGDYGLMHDLVRYLNGDRSSVSITSIDDSVNSHLICYAADESNKTGKTIKL